MALVAASLPAIVRTMMNADVLEHLASMVSHPGGRGRWIPGLKSWTSDWTVVKELEVGMPWIITLYQISSFLRPGCYRYGCSDSFLNGRGVRFED